MNQTIQQKKTLHTFNTNKPTHHSDEKTVAKFSRLLSLQARVNRQYGHPYLTQQAIK